MIVNILSLDTDLNLFLNTRFCEKDNKQTQRILRWLKEEDDETVGGEEDDEENKYYSDDVSDHNNESEQDCTKDDRQKQLDYL
ncbi:hypothetical protein GWI33_006991 [Rhynchophorus ferrugineus]|uniref:Uncharacterized protein n=1 Tax=Rhynchophorus ferrugineus TaxID=354439 RepID=A0A834MCH8_RHYFE|nr:hypothetical protein GWI33_006991 [Rhynchophorus ferrugineus]